MHFTRSGSGRPILLIHGLGSSARAWDSISGALAAEREIIAIDLPGHGYSPVEQDSGTFDGLVRSTNEFLEAACLVGVDVAGHSLGGRLALELSRQGKVGAVVALDPGGFWQGWELAYFHATSFISIRVLRAIGRFVPALSANFIARTLLLGQLSAKPWALEPDVVDQALKSLIATTNFDELLHDHSRGVRQNGPADSRSGAVTIGWGRKDRLCLPIQAARALRAFPSAELYWFEECGHFPIWDQPEETASLILRATSERRVN